MPGSLYVVATPIGNLDDMTYRATKVLAEVTLIACEDTRKTSKLLRHYRLRTKTTSYHEHNEQQKTPKLIERLESGEDIALVSDAGTPMISDPGFRLVRAARERGLSVLALPGASAVVAALAVSGLPTSKFTFLGFLPARGQARKDALEGISGLDHTTVVFESPARIGRLLSDLSKSEPNRPASILREMTKLHEEHRMGPLQELAAWAQDRRFKGELTLVLGPASKEARTVEVSELAPRFQELRDRGLSARAASKELAKTYGVSSREVYNAFGRG